MNSIKIHQIYYQADQIKHISDAIPYDNSNDSSGMCEYGVFMKEFDNILSSSEKYIGYLSWKFTQKTKKQPKDFIEYINKNPGYDLYAMQPFPLSLFKNGVWSQANNYCKPIGQIYDIINLIKKELNLDNKIFDDHIPKNKIVLCNYWIATKPVWEKYKKLTLPIAQLLINKAKNDDGLYTKLFIRTTNLSSSWGNLFPYIMERLIVSLLQIDDDIRTNILHLADNIVAHS